MSVSCGILIDLELITSEGTIGYNNIDSRGCFCFTICHCLAVYMCTLRLNVLLFIYFIHTILVEYYFVIVVDVALKHFVYNLSI